MSTLQKLQNCYQAQCNGDWEHSYGVEIGTLDNPGWRVKIQLKGTTLEGAAFTEISRLEPESDWIRCCIAEGSFQGAGGAKMLEEILQSFLIWAEGNDK